MAHSIIAGQTESGKTTLARKIAQDGHTKGIKSIVLDPVDPNSWAGEHCFTTDNQEEFLKVFWSSKNCNVFIDEGSETIARGNLAMKKCLTKGRHAGHSVFIISQRVQDMDKTARDQCKYLFLFRVSLDDAKLLANEFSNEELKNAKELREGKFYFANRFGQCEYKEVF